MKYLKLFFLFNLVVSISCTGFAQKQTFDVVSYTSPKGWQQQKNDAFVQLSVKNKKTGAYAIALITKAAAGDAGANENFKTDWNRLIKGSVQVNTEPAMQQPVNENGWDIISGTANYTDGAQKGIATLLTATGGGQMTSVVLMTNTDTYQNELVSFLNSLELAKASSNTTGNKKTENTNNANSPPIVGMWIFYNTESSGNYNGFPQLTGGYMRREYVFYKDGTYLFRAKDWMVYGSKYILYICETGVYSVKGNQITITPKTGKGEWWEKVTNNTKAWGKFVRASSDYKLEPVTYSFVSHFFSGSGEDVLILKSAKPTIRDGAKSSNQNEQEYRYTSREFGNTLIDNPPGFKTGFENKQLNTSSAAKTTNAEQPISSKANNALAGKIWEAKSTEKYGASYGDMSNFYTGGFWVYQYQFNTNGTYRFVYNSASALATNPVNVLQFETGTYTVNANSVTITPVSGTNEEWSVGKINGGMSADHIRQVLETRIKRVKTTTRKLEKITYSFSVEFWQGNNANALCLKHTQNTVREGSPGQNDQSCFFETTTEKVKKFNFYSNK